VYATDFDYNTGGFFNLYDQIININGEQHKADYQILIGSIKNEKAYEALKLLCNQNSQDKNRL
jgi:hypothetical protein